MKTHSRLVVLAMAFAAPLCANQALATTYYIKNTGTDTADGLSNATAWQTISKVNSTAFLPGDQILFRAGQIFRDATLVPSSSGNATASITYGSYMTGAKPILTTAIVLPSTGWVASGTDTYSHALPTITRMVTVNNTYMVRAASAAALQAGQYFWDSTTGTLYVRDANGNPNTSGRIYEAAQRDNVILSTAGKDYLSFSGLRFEKANYNLAVLDSRSDHHTFDNCEFFCGSGNTQRAAAGLLSNNCDYTTITNSHLSYLEGDGIYVQSGSNMIVNGNTVDHLYDQGGDNGPDGIQINGLKRAADNFTVMNNTVIRETNTTAKGCIIVGGTAGCSNGTISGNKAYKGIFGIAFYGKNAVIEYNYTEDTGYADGIRLWENLGEENVTIRYNIVNSATTSSGISIGNGNAPATPQPNINIYNNIIYNTRYGITYGVASSGGMWNNIIWSPMANPTRRLRFVGFITGQNWESNYNLIQDQGTGHRVEWLGVNFDTFASYQATSHQDLDSKTADPQWVNAPGGDFHLQATSQAINTGTSFGPILDYDSNPVPNGPAPDMGAFEYGDTLAYEGFDYSTGVFTSGTGGTGWADAWVASGSAGGTDILASSMAYTGLPTAGNHFRVYDTDGVYQEIRRTLRKTFGAKPETYWISFLAKKTQSGRESILDLNGLTFHVTSTDWQVKTPTTSYVTIPNSNFATLHLIICRVDATATTDTVRVWVDPAISAGDPSSTAAAATVTAPHFTFNTVALRNGPFGNSLQCSEWDELHFARTFAGVTSLP